MRLNPISQKLVRSRSVVENGKDTHDYDWTECFYVFGFLVRSITVRKIGYAEAMAIFGYEKQLKSGFKLHRGWDYRGLIITYNK